MASSDPRIRQSGSSAVQVMKLATYANANYDIGGQEPYLCRTLDEKDLRNVSVTQVLEDFLAEDYDSFRTRGVAKLKIIPSDSSVPPLQGSSVSSVQLENQLKSLFGELRDFDFISHYSEQRVASQEESLGYKLPEGMVEVCATRVPGRMNMSDFFSMCHTQRRFAPLTGNGGNILATYWEKMRDFPDTMNFECPLYAVDIRASPTHMSNWAWDFSDLGKDSPLTNILTASLKRGPGYQWFIPGLQSPLSYIASSGSFFAYHDEDFNLLSMNVHLGGYPKVWYIIRPESVVDLKQAVKYCLKKGYPKDHYHNKCKDPLRHRCFLFTPDWLREWGIHHEVMSQEPNQIVLTLPLGGHQGLNIGPMVNEAINIAVPQWLPYGKRATECNCDYVGFYPPDFSLLPFAHEWEPQSRVEDYILGRESGNTVITNADQGYLPGTGSRAVQRRHAKSIVKTKENAYMFKLVQGKDGDRKEFYYSDGRMKELVKISKEPKPELDELDEQISQVFGIDEESILAKSCKTIQEFRIAQLDAKKKKKVYLADTGRTSLFDTYRHLVYAYK